MTTDNDYPPVPMRQGADPYQHYEPHDGQAALRNQIVQTRADLGETISELASRTDVKARAKEAVTEVRARTKAALKARARDATMRTRGAARSGAESARHVVDRTAHSPASIAVGGGAGALAGLGIYALIRRRLPLGIRWPSRRGRGRR
jgi:hypothetical protein